MTTKRQLRVELADAQTTISALRATVAAASEDRDRAVAEMADVSRKLTERSNRLDTFADAIADQDAKLTEATTQLAERGEALRIALEQAARVCQRSAWRSPASASVSLSMRSERPSGTAPPNIRNAALRP